MAAICSSTVGFLSLTITKTVINGNKTCRRSYICCAGLFEMLFVYCTVLHGCHCRSYESQQTAGSSRDVTHWQNTGTTVSRLVASLRDVTDKLQNAYSGRDVLWSSAGQ